jgi:uroporphyrinogen III methyltransferase / synthase
MKLSFKGKRIVLTRSTAAGDDWEKYLKRCGAIVYKFPTIETSRAPLTPKLRGALAHLGDFGWIIFTSAAGPYYMKDMMKRAGIKVLANKMPPVAAVGERTAEAVREIDRRVRFVPSKANGRTLGQKLKPLRSPILLLRSDIASPDLPKALRERGARVVDLAVYETKTILTPAPKQFIKLLKNGEIDHLIFASPSAVAGFVARVKGDAMKAARNIPVIALGLRIRKGLTQAGFHDVHVVREVTTAALADAIVHG